MKAAIVDLDNGTLVSERLRISTPKPATPAAMAAVAAELVHRHEWSGPIGVGFPGIVRHGVVHSAANLDASWVGVDADRVNLKGKTHEKVDAVGEGRAIEVHVVVLLLRRD